MTKFGLVVAVLGGLVACGGGSGLDPALKMNELDATQQTQWCDYVTGLEIEACSTATSTTTGEYTSAQCVAEFPLYDACDITVGTMEECYGEIEADPCTGGLSQPCLEYFECLMAGFGNLGS
jgi:hypothetical protein